MDELAENETEEGSSVQEQIVELLNATALLSDPSIKVVNLNKLQELILHQEGALLDGFLDEVVAFQNDSNADVRRAVIAFIEAACKKDCQVIPRVVTNLSMLLQDSSSAAVVKRTIQAVSVVYRTALQWLSAARTLTEPMEISWGVLCEMKREVLTYLDHDNDGVRTIAVKFMESLVLVQSYSEDDGLQRRDFCLDDVPLTLKIARPRKLEEESRSVFDSMLKFHGSVHISSVNLMACMSSITMIARYLPSLAGRVVAALESLHANLPPTLAKSQVNSVRKHMKMQLLNLLKQAANAEHHQNICTLLTDLGASQAEVMKVMPSSEQLKKRQRRSAAECSEQKRAKISESLGSEGSTINKVEQNQNEQEYDDDEDDDEEYIVKPAESGERWSAEDTVESWVMERLTAAVATNLVIASMSRLPDSVSAQFSNTYTPIAAAGTHSQIRHVSRLLAAQLSHAGVMLPGVKVAASDVRANDWEMDDDSHTSDRREENKQRAVGGDASSNKLVPCGQTRRRPARALKLSEVTTALSPGAAERFMTATLDRFLSAAKVASSAGLSKTHTKLLTMMSAHLSSHLIEKMLVHVLEDISGRSDLCMAWLFEEYTSMLGHSNFGHLIKSQCNYEQIVCMLISALLSRPDLSDAHTLLVRICLQAPALPASCIDILSAHVTSDADNCDRSISLMLSLAQRRPPKQLQLMTSLLELSCCCISPVRQAAITAVLQLYDDYQQLSATADEKAVSLLRCLTLPQPPKSLLEATGGGGGGLTSTEWSEELVRHCLRLYLRLLPKNEALIHELANVYVQTTADVKRAILRVVELPVRSMGTCSPQLLTLVEKCPKGAETLITRIIHILTDRCAPSQELVVRVRELYQQRVSDVRFLIPVLTGLERDEVIAALPKLIKLNPVVVKEVFARLLGIHSETSEVVSPLTPEDLLVALHNIDPSACDMKTVIKATALCFSEKHVYTQEVLAVVLQRLMEQEPLPTLLMRTVIQSLALYSRLVGLVMNILQRLIGREVWRQRRVWEGFIKCCQRARPNSYQVLLQLPAEPLAEVFEAAPELRAQLLDHVNSFSENQRGHVPSDLMKIITSDVRVKTEKTQDDKEPAAKQEAPIVPLSTVKQEACDKSSQQITIAAKQ